MYQLFDENLFQVIEDWGWDKNEKVMPNSLLTATENFPHIKGFVWAQQLIEPMLPLVTYMQGK